MPKQYEYINNHPIRFQKIKILITIALLGVFLIFPGVSMSQYFDLGNEPASVRWKQLNTEHYRVIFPENIEKQAQYIANGMETFYVPGSASLEVQPARFPLILHNNTVFSNALVPYAPKRIEFLTTSPQDNYASPWIDGLILHEFRHTVQYKSVDRGLTKALSYVIGQQALPLVIGLFVPLWFIEGDATVNETAFSRSGRGRVPSFEQKLRAQFLEKGIYTYDKAVNGSYKDFTPDRYELGYQLVGRTRTEFGKEVWANVMKKVGTIPIMLVPFSYSLKEQTGFCKVKLYKHLTTHMKDAWMLEDVHLERTQHIVLPTETKYYTSLTMPVVLDNGDIIAIKTSIDDIDRIVSVSKDGTLRKIVTPGTGFQPYSLSASDSFLCWGEFRSDPRWALRDYAVIKIYNLETKKTRQITHQGRYFAPAINRTGDKVVAVKVSTDNKYSLVILDSWTGDELKEYSTQNNLFFLQPSWSEDGSRVISVVQDKNGKSLLIWTPEAGTSKIVLPFSFSEISRPALVGEEVYFSGSFSGIDNIYSLNLQTGEISQLSSVRFGAIDTYLDRTSGNLVFSNYSADGYRIAELPPSGWMNRALPYPQRSRYALADSLSKQEGFIYDPDSVPDHQYEVKKYRKGLNLFNFHSWAPLSVNTSSFDVKPGVMVLSQNLLSSSFTTLGYEYDLNDQAGSYYLNYTYSGLYPQFDLGMKYGLKRGAHTDDNDSVTRFKYHELDLSGTVSIPLSWSVNSWYMGVRPSIGYSYKYLNMDPASPLQFVHDRISAFNSGLYYYALESTSRRDLQPRWGTQLLLAYSQTAFDSLASSNSILSGQGWFYLPGFFRHHGFKLYAGYQYRKEGYYGFSNRINVARGHSGIYSDDMATFSLSYIFPVFCPDWRIGPIFYIKRMKAAIFYDQTLAFDYKPALNYNTVGLDVSFDFHFLTNFVPLELGLRSMYFPDSGTMGFEMIWSINIGNIY